MIDKEKIIKLIENKKYVEVIFEFHEDFLFNLKKVLELYKIEYKDDITLIECISLIDIFVPLGESITHVPMTTIYNESREIESRANFALQWYDRWMENVSSLKN